VWSAIGIIHLQGTTTGQLHFMCIDCIPYIKKPFRQQTPITCAAEKHLTEKHLTVCCSLVQWSELWKLRNYDTQTPLGVCTVRALMLAVFKSLRNSSRLILPSLSMSASSRRGSMEPFIPVCCRQEQHVNNQPKYINNSISALFKIIQYSKMSMKNQKCMNNWVPVLVTN